jgi:hypothetical protein
MVILGRPMLNIMDFRGVTFSCSVSLPCARAPSVLRLPEDLLT